MNGREACEECIQKCLENHRQKKDPSPIITSFYKLIYGKYKFEKYLRLPPRVCTVVPGLTDGEYYTLEDCNGKKSKVKLGTIDGDLAFTKGWDKFYDEHGLAEGDIVLFNYTPGHFSVRIYNNTCCEQVNFVTANEKNRKRSTTDGNLDPKDGKRQKSPDGSTRKQSPADSIISRSEDRTQRKFTTNDQPPNDSGLSGQGGRSPSEPMSMDKCPASENRNCGFQPASTANMKQIRLDGEENNREKLYWSTEPETSTIVLNENLVLEKVVSDEVSAEVAAKMFKKLNDPPMGNTIEVIDNDKHNSDPSDPLIDKHVGGHIETTSMTKEVGIVNKDHQDGDQAGQQFKTQESEHAKSIQSSKKVEVVHDDRHVGNVSGPPLRISSIADLTATKKIVKHKEATRKEKHTGETLNEPKEVLMERDKRPSGISYNENRTSSGAENGNVVEVNTEPVDPEASGISFVVTVESQEFLRLPNKIRENHAKERREIVDLKGPDGRVWPVFYHQKHGVQVLTDGWKHFCKTYDIQNGFECTFTPKLVSAQLIVYKVEINRK